MNGAELLVAALENEGVRQIFGVPGEENLDVVEALRRSRIELVLTRHEQAAAFMAATHGRLTGRRACASRRSGPGALNLTTGAAYALLGAMPMVMITGQKGVLSRKQARFQVVDIVSTMTPLTKMAHQIVSPATIPSMVREAFRVAAAGAARARSTSSCRRTSPPRRRRTCRSCRRTRSTCRSPTARRSTGRRSSIAGRERPLVMLGAAASRPRLADALSDFVRRLQIPFFNTQMGKGAVAGGSGLYMGTAALSEARLCPSGDRSRRPHHLDRSRHGREAAVLHGPERPDGAARGLPAGHGRGGVFPAGRGDRRRRPEPQAARRPAGGRAAERRRAPVICARASSRTSASGRARAATR